MKHFYQNIPGWFSYRGVYEQAVREAPDPARFVEVGCWKGRSTAFLAVEIINSGKVIGLWCVDTWLGSAEKKHQDDPAVINGMLYKEFRRNLAPIDTRSDFYIVEIRTPSVQAAATFENASLDFVMIDAAHDYDNVLADLTAWWPKIKPGGVMAGDDYHFSGVNKAVNEFFSRETGAVERVPGSGTGVAWRVRR